MNTKLFSVSHIVSHVACGISHSLVVREEDGQSFAFGDNEDGEWDIPEGSLGEAVCICDHDSAIHERLHDKDRKWIELALLCFSNDTGYVSLCFDFFRSKIDFSCKFIFV